MEVSESVMKLCIVFLAFVVIGLAAPEERKLTVEQLALAQSEDGTPVPSDFQFLPGDMVFFSCRASGFARQGDEPPKMFLTYEIEVRDSKGVLLVPIETGKIAADLSPEDKEWRPKIRDAIALPATLDSGAYQVLVKVNDQFAKTASQANMSLLVHGNDVAPSDSLIVRNYRFLRSEEDKNPMEVAAYRPGDMVWSRFDMTGYKLGPKNNFDVDYGLKVLRPDGTTTYDQPKAAEAQNQSFYPQRYTPGVLSLNLPKNLKTGEYTIVLTVHDNVGQQTYETRTKFSVE
jgi:hypothetical protein